MRTLISTIALMLFTVFTLSAQELSPKSVAKSDNIEVVYGQPSKRNRAIFGQLVPYGEVWRTGANEATTVELKADASFGGKPVKKGKYTLFTIPGVKEWTVILNSELEQWGAYEYDKHKSKNVAEVKVPVYTLDKTQEKLQINPKKDALVIEWDQTGVSIPVSY
ncbi:MAG: DUF2911 domain-containing protein [Sphingobacteriales bacterium]|nr:MAG: DUF2911 domain-containing protein [Sphingobacteriales bacterium]